MDKQLSMYESMSAISQKMVVAAERMDWDLLVSLEKEVAILRTTLMSENERFFQKTDCSDEIRKRKMVLINTMLSDDKTIRSYTTPWMDGVKIFLSGNAKKRTVLQTYGLGH